MIFESSKIVVLRKKRRKTVMDCEKKSVLQDTFANLTKMTIYM